MGHRRRIQRRHRTQVKRDWTQMIQEQRREATVSRLKRDHPEIVEFLNMAAEKVMPWEGVGWSMFSGWLFAFYKAFGFLGERYRGPLKWIDNGTIQDAVFLPIRSQREFMLEFSQYEQDRVRDAALDELSDFELAERQGVIREAWEDQGGVQGFLDEIEAIGELERDVRQQTLRRSK